MPLHQVIYSTTGREAPVQLTKQLANLETAFWAAFKKKMSVELYISDWGDVKSPIYGLTAYYEPAQRAEVDFLIKNLS